MRTCGSRSFNVSIMIVLREAERLPELLVKTMKMAVAFTGEPGGRTVTDEIIASAKVNASFRIVNVEKKLNLNFHLPVSAD